MTNNPSQPLDDVSAESLLGQVADEFVERLDRGERVGIEEYAERYPQIASEIRQVLPALAVMQPADENAEPVCDGSLQETQIPSTLGDFRIIREVGRGGMGIVYEAEQVSIGRRVALKVMPFAAMLDPKQLQRFKNEVHATGQLHHTNIVPVFSVGCERGVHFYAMQYIEGQTLADVIRQLRRDAGLEKQEVIGDRLSVIGEESKASHHVPITDHRSPIT